MKFYKIKKKRKKNQNIITILILKEKVHFCFRVRNSLLNVLVSRQSAKQIERMF